MSNGNSQAQEFQHMLATTAGALHGAIIGGSVSDDQLRKSLESIIESRAAYKRAQAEAQAAAAQAVTFSGIRCEKCTVLRSVSIDDVELLYGPDAAAVVRADYEQGGHPMPIEEVVIARNHVDELVARHRNGVRAGQQAAASQPQPVQPIQPPQAS